MDDHNSPHVQYPEFLREEDERFYAVFPNARQAVPSQWQIQSLGDSHRDSFGSAAFYYGSANSYTSNNLNYPYPQYSYGESLPSLSYAPPDPFASDTMSQPCISNDSELAHAQDNFPQQSMFSDFSSGGSSSPENLYSPVEDSHQLYASSPQYPQPSLMPSPSATLPDAAEPPDDLSSLDSKSTLKRRRVGDTDFDSSSSLSESPRSYIYKIPLQKPLPVPTPKPSKARNPAQGEKKSLALACFFCRGRKIACGRQDPNSSDRTCNQCFRRSLKCEYPTESRRGMRKKKTVISDNSMRPLVAD